MEDILKKIIRFLKDCKEAAEKVKEDMEGTKVQVKLGKLFWKAWKAAGLPGTEGKVPSNKEIEQAVRRSNSNQKCGYGEIAIVAICGVLKGIASVYQECKENDSVGAGLKLFESVAELFKTHLDKASNVLYTIASHMSTFEPFIAGGVAVAATALRFAPEILSFCHKWRKDGFEAAFKELLEVETIVKKLGQFGGRTFGIWAGMKIGATFGGLIGGPVGVAVGSVVGCIAGGILGHLAGGWVAEKLCENKYVKTACEKVNNFTKKVVSGVVSTAKKVWGWFKSWF